MLAIVCLENAHYKSIIKINFIAAQFPLNNKVILTVITFSIPIPTLRTLNVFKNSRSR